MKLLKPLLIAAGLLTTGPVLAHSSVDAGIGVVVNTPGLYVTYRDYPRDHYVYRDRYVHRDRYADRHYHRPPHGRAWGHYRHRHDRYCHHGH